MSVWVRVPLHVCVFDQLTGPFEQRDKPQRFVLKAWRRGQRLRSEGKDGEGGQSQKVNHYHCMMYVSGQ